MKLFQSLLFFFIINFSFSQSTSKFQKIDSLLSVSNKRGFFNGNALVMANDTVIYEGGKGFADASKNKALTDDLRFSIGSVSKEFDGTAIMILKERGKLSLDDKVSEFFPQLPAWASKISIRNLLRYTSGLPEPDYNKIRTDEQVWRFLNDLEKLNFDPGSNYFYNNTNVFLRKRIVEKVSGKSYSEFVTENILRPCKMSGAVIDPTERTENMAHSFDNYFVQDSIDVYMSGWVNMTPRDLLKWNQCLHSEKILGEDSVNELFKSFNPSAQSPLGNLIYKDGKPYFQYHQGASDNFEASLYHNFQDGFTVILMTNNRNSNVGDLTNAIDAILRGEAFEIPKKSIEMSLRTEIFYSGFEEGMQWYDSIKKYQRNIFDFEHEEEELTNTAEYLQEKEHSEEALKMFSFITENFPKSAKAWLSLADAYNSEGKTALAKLYYRKALKLDSENKRAKKMLEKLNSSEED